MAYCKRVLASKRKFDRRSFRWKKRGRGWVMTGCRRGHFKHGRCNNGLRAHVVLAKSNGRCFGGERVVRKG